MTRVTDEPGDLVRATPASCYDDGAATRARHRGRQPDLIVPGTGQIYGLFYVYPLTEQQQSLFVVRGALITDRALCSSCCWASSPGW